MKKIILTTALSLAATSMAHAQLMNQAKDMSRGYVDMTATYFFADKLSQFDTTTGEGKVQWARYSLEPRQAFNTNTVVADKLQMKDFPDTGYENDPAFRFKVDFISDRTVRVRMLTSLVAPKEVEEMMLSAQFMRDNPHATWTCTEDERAITYSSSKGSLTIEKHPWRLVLKDANGKVLTQTWTNDDNWVSQVKLLPFGFKKSGTDNSRMLNPVFSLKAGERIYGCGESPTGLNKAGQKVHLFVTDPQGPETDEMYKPVPFFFSNRGYGMFMHTSAPVTCDFGATYVGATKLFMADESVDFFFFIGNPAEILNEYTNLVGKTPMPPLWSFGTWMSRITYLSDKDAYGIAKNLRDNRIPADVIHLDTGWFGVDWQCDYKFAEDRFDNPQKMVKDLLDDGFHISLWQLPYFTQHNVFYNELIEKDLVVRNADGSLPYEDACLDFTNPEAVKWYQGHLRNLLDMGVGAIKVDFGEGAPYDGFYHNGRGGLYEHNLYPVRYNKAVWDVTKDVQKDGAIIWARSAWAGSQRYPLHWGGDAANTNEAMLSTLHAGMSFGLSGFPFWSHDIGGFVQSTPEDLYRRWLPFGFLTSHTRSHGAPPTEPWLYNQEFTDYYRANAEMKYALMPYIVEQAKVCTETGLPMVRAMFIEYPDDPVAWMVEDQYLFGKDILVAPIFDAPQAFVDPADNYNNTDHRPSTGLRHWTRKVYLPGGPWVDYQTGKVYQAGWNDITTDKLEAVILVRKGAVIPTAKVAQSTKDIDWEHVKNVKY